MPSLLDTLMMGVLAYYVLALVYIYAALVFGCARCVGRLCV